VAGPGDAVDPGGITRTGGVDEDGRENAEDTESAEEYEPTTGISDPQRGFGTRIRKQPKTEPPEQ